MLEIAELARGLAMIAQARAAGLDRIVEHRMDRAYQPLGVIGRLAPGNALALSGPCRKRRGEPPWRQMRTMERLADIDVAKPRHHTLVEQSSLEARLLARAGLRQHRGIELVAERL